ncbi:6-bladed beta-propeller [Prolixibacteraceae bacterium JC049]|nr:6-bladed beta-propeller [Prolixibacteraceae bacterium JC049]
MNFKLLYYLLIALIAISCGKIDHTEAIKIVKKGGHDVMVCDVSKVKDTIQLKLSDLITECHMVKLETSPEAFFKWGYVTLSDNYIGVRSSRQPYKLFDKKGKFIRDIGKVGRGPNEFMNIYCEQIDEANGTIYLMPWQSPRLLRFSIEGEAMQPIPLLQKQPKGKFRVKNNQVDVVSLPFPNSKYIAYTQTLSGETVNKVIPKDYMRVRNFSNELQPFNTNDINVSIFRLNKAIKDTLYQYKADSDQLIPKLTLINGLDKVPYHGYDELPNHYLMELSVRKQVNENNYHIMPFGKVVIDKQTKEAHFFNLVNDFYGDMPIPTSFHDGYFVQSIPPIYLIKNIEKALKNKKLSADKRNKLMALKSELDPEDNNVIFWGKLKS